MDTPPSSTSKRPSLTGNTPPFGDGGRILASLESERSRSTGSIVSLAAKRRRWLRITLSLCLLLLIAVPAYLLLPHQSPHLPSPVNTSPEATLPSVTDGEELLPALIQEQSNSALILDEAEEDDMTAKPVKPEPRVAESTQDSPRASAPPASHSKQRIPPPHQAALPPRRANTKPSSRTAAQQSGDPELLNSLIQIINRRPEQTAAQTSDAAEKQPQSMDELIQQINNREQQNRRSNARALERIRSAQSQEHVEKLQSQAQEALEKSR